jgi:hypothetical protein
MIAADPHQGGATWAVLQYLLGLRRLGHEVVFVEPIGAASLRPAGGHLDRSTNASYFRRVCADFGLEGSAALLRVGTRETVGPPYDELRQVGHRAHVLLNISGMLTDPELIGSIPVRAYLDLDPAFNQLWQATQGIDMRFAGHTHFVTVGLALGQPDCPVPTCGQRWHTTLPPVVLEHWPQAGPITQDAFTTVGNWRGYGCVEHEGVSYGQKAHSWRRFLALPTRTGAKLRPALAIHPGETKDIAQLAANGWQVLDPTEVAATPAAYHHFIQGSRGELGIAKSGYVAARCGWFSDRSACYLASGRPVLAQETGFSRFLPTGAGLFAFESIDDVVAALEKLQADYARHAKAARFLAVDCFDSDKVLSALLAKLGV